MRGLIAGVLGLVVSLWGVPSKAASILANGDFSAGNVGFTSDYTYTNNIYPAGTAFVGFDPQTYHDGAASYPDHTSGDGLMLIANGSEAIGATVWQQTVSVGTFTDYEFSAWAASWGRADWSVDPSVDPSPAQLRFSVNGVSLGADFVLPAGDALWSEFTATWNSGTSTTATLRIVDVNLAAYGNDFTLDDLTFDKAMGATPVPEPASLILLSSGLLGLAGYGRRKGRQ